MKSKKAMLTLEEFGTAMGLTQLDKALIRQKNALIDYLKEVRSHQGVTQADLAHRLRTTQPAIARMETGQVGDISFDFLIRVALALGISLGIGTSRKAAALP